MKYMNHLRKLALLSSLALSFAVRADGTLPLPGIEIRPIKLVGNVKMEQPLTEADNTRLELRVQNFDSAPTAANVPGFGNPCERGAAYYEGSGTVTQGNESFPLAGVCVPRGSSSTSESGSLPRIVVASDGDKLLLLSGIVTYAANQITVFRGNLIVKGAGEVPSLKFELIPIN